MTDSDNSKPSDTNIGTVQGDTGTAQGASASAGQVTAAPVGAPGDVSAPSAADAWVGGGAYGVWLERWVPSAEAAIEGLGYQMADVERGGAGLLRVTLDSPDGIGVEDCERVSHQLSRLLEVEAVSYERLEISSPGVDRALKRQRDFDQFIGEEVSVKLRRALDNRKQYSGVLGKGEGDAYTLMIPAEKKNGEDRELVFTLSELDSARLVPQLNFRRASK